MWAPRSEFPPRLFCVLNLLAVHAPSLYRPSTALMNHKRLLFGVLSALFIYLAGWVLWTLGVAIWSITMYIWFVLNIRGYRHRTRKYLLYSPDTAAMKAKAEEVHYLQFCTSRASSLVSGSAWQTRCVGDVDNRTEPVDFAGAVNYCGGAGG